MGTFFHQGVSDIGKLLKIIFIEMQTAARTEAIRRYCEDRIDHADKGMRSRNRFFEVSIVDHALSMHLPADKCLERRMDNASAISGTSKNGF
jgi:hypothetical protein